MSLASVLPALCPACFWLPVEKHRRAGQDVRCALPWVPISETFLCEQVCGTSKCVCEGFTKMGKLAFIVLVIYSLLEPVSGEVEPHCEPSALCVPKLMATSVCCKHEKVDGR